MGNTLAIIGSARSDSNARKALKAISPIKEYGCLDLLDFKINHYRYDRTDWDDDDFGNIVSKLLEADNIIFVTPVYWYSMSGLLKVFFDRLTDLISFKKEIGRQLAGKKVYLVTCGSDANMPEGFEVPFSMTCKYLDMQYCGAHYLSL